MKNTILENNEGGEPTEMAETRKNRTMEESEEIPILQYLSDHRRKLEVLLSAEPKEMALFKINGQRKTRTVYIAEALQQLMTEFCNVNRLSMAEFCETAIVRFLVANGWEEQIRTILVEPTEIKAEPIRDESE